MKAKERAIKAIIDDMGSIFTSNPSNMTWHKIGETLVDKGWCKEFADRDEYKVTEDDVKTAFFLLTNFADEIVEIVDDGVNFVDKVDMSLRHLQIYELYNEFNEDNSNGEYEKIWNKFKKNK